MLDCAFPFQKYPVVTLAHGAGGRFTQQLIDDVFTAALGTVQAEHDGAIFETEGTLAFSTDAHVVKPLFFPGGDIGKLAVTGTCNDLVMCGAQPQYLSCAWIIEEGFSTKTLFEIARSMADSGNEIGVKLVTGDTKVVERGNGDGVYLNVSGVGIQRTASHPSRIEAGDAIILSGDLGRHGCAILTQREELQLQAPIHSDCSHLWPLLQKLLAGGQSVHCMRDLTRGGLATALVELGGAADVHISIQREKIPVSDAVASVCELFGLDPLYVANEGRMVLMVPPGGAERTLQLLGNEAAYIGHVEPGRGVVVENQFGTSQVLDLLGGEQLPRIC